MTLRNKMIVLDLFAEELRLSHEALNSITIEFTSDDLLGEIFLLSVLVNNQNI